MDITGPILIGVVRYSVLLLICSRNSQRRRIIPRRSLLLVMMAINIVAQGMPALNLAHHLILVGGRIL